MQHFLSTTEVAAELGINLSTLNSRIRAGDFAEPDGLTGGRIQGWLRSTIDEWANRNPTRTIIDSDAVAAIITELRRAAETIRTYGARRTGTSNPDIIWTIPAELYTLTGRLESEIRGYLLVEMYNAAKHDVDGFHDPDIMEFTTAAVPIHRVFPVPDEDIRYNLLNRARVLIDLQIEALKKTFVTRTRNLYVDKLTAIVGQLQDYLDTIAPAAAAAFRSPAGSPCWPGSE